MRAVTVCPVILLAATVIGAEIAPAQDQRHFRFAYDQPKNTGRSMPLMP